MLAADLGIESVQDLLETRLELDGRMRGREFEIYCPNPSHDDSNLGNCSVNTTTGLWSCFSCGKGGDLVGLAALVWACDRDSAEARLKPNTPEALLQILTTRLEAARSPRTVATGPPLAVPSDYADGPLEELLERGFEEETLRRWGIRYVPHETLQGHNGPFNIQASIGIPVRDSSGRVINWCYRTTRNSQDWQPRYLYAAPVGRAWFGAHLHGDEREVVVVEGALDAMWLDQHGIPAVALLGASMVEKKAEWLRRYGSVTILGDRDSGGLLATIKLGNRLGPIMPIRVATYPKWLKGRDPQELGGLDLEIVMARARPWVSWAVSTGNVVARKKEMSRA